MNPRVPLLALAAFLLCMQSACRRSANTRNLATVDSLLHATDSLIGKMKTLDLSGVERIDSLYALKEARIQERMRDTLQKEEALTLGNYYHTMSKNPKRAIQGRLSVLQRSEQSLSQLTNLRNDVEKGLLEPTVELRYIGDEVTALAQVMRDGEMVEAAAASVIRDDARYGAVIDSMLVKDTIPAR